MSDTPWFKPTGVLDPDKHGPHPGSRVLASAPGRKHAPQGTRAAQPLGGVAEGFRVPGVGRGTKREASNVASDYGLLLTGLGGGCARLAPAEQLPSCRVVSDAKAAMLLCCSIARPIVTPLGTKEGRLDDLPIKNSERRTPRSGQTGRFNRIEPVREGAGN